MNPSHSTSFSSSHDASERQKQPPSGVLSLDDPTAAELNKRASIAGFLDSVPLLSNVPELNEESSIVRLGKIESAIGYLTLTVPQNTDYVDYFWEMSDKSFGHADNLIPDSSGRRMIEMAENKESLIVNLRFVRQLRRLIFVINGNKELKLDTYLGSYSLTISSAVETMEVYVYQGEIFLRFSTQNFSSRNDVSSYYGLKRKG